jgi:hypothetical protein
VGRAVKSLVRLDPRTVLHRAQQRTGLDDFGGDDFREPLTVLLDACATEARLSFLGRLFVQGDIVELLANRLRLEDAHKRDASLAGEVVRRPVFIVGLPRTGTTLLHRLLGQDPANRLPETWEVMHPWPPLTTSDPSADPRIALAERRLRWLHLLAPDFRTIHPVGARLPIECIALTAASFRSPRFHTTYRVPSYQVWLAQQDLRSAYMFHKRFLQLLQRCRAAERWVLKAPAHLFHLEDLFDVYPDAMIVQTHRDPLTVLASVASLTATLQRAFAESVDLAEIGAEVVDRWAEGLEGVLRFRNSNAALNARFIDVHYPDLVQDPIATVRRVYDRLGIPFLVDVGEPMRRFLAANPQGKHGTHSYSLAQFRLDPEALTPRFKAYRDYFDVEAEPGRYA